jgi:hypothetical protein
VSRIESLRSLNACPHCGITPAACPFCGKPGQVFDCATVGCSDTVNCAGQVEFGHWVGEINGRPDVCFVIEQWNKRFSV